MMTKPARLRRIEQVGLSGLLSRAFTPACRRASRSRAHAELFQTLRARQSTGVALAFARDADPTPPHRWRI